jgi:RNA polymerase sigma-70 factor (ECF subfamily)
MTNTMAVEFISESTLVARAQSGDADAYAQLVKTYEPRMLRTALRVVRDMEDAQDATQQAFTSAWVNLHKFRGDAQFSTWITRITINESLGVLRRRKNVHVELREGLLDNDDAQDSPVAAAENPETSLLRREVVRIVRQSLRFVKPVYRDAMKLRILEDLSVEEIAGRLDIPVNTVKVHLFRGRQAMKSFLTERLGYAAA